MVNTVIFMGLPGAGKGKQSELLSARTGFLIHSTGNEYRKMAHEDGVAAKKVAEVLAAGGLQPAWLSSYMFQKTLLTLSLEQGVIFEGVGRKEPEARLFSEVCEWLGRDFRIVYLNVKEETSVDRLNKRREIEGREDDLPHIMQNRFKNFHDNTVSAVEYFRSIGKVIDIDGEPLPEVVSTEVWEKLNA